MTAIFACRLRIRAQAGPGHEGTNLPANIKLSRHDPDVQDWNKLSADERRLYARMMEVFAGFLEHTDHYLGELIAFLISAEERFKIVTARHRTSLFRAINALFSLI